MDNDPTRPPKVLCLFCEYGIPHEHRNGYPPLLPCRNCWVGVHDECDPATYFCCCDDPNCVGGTE